MTVLNKLSKGITNEQILGVIALVFVVFAFYKYSEGKNLLQSPMTALNPASYLSNPSIENVSSQSITNSNTTYAPYNGNSNSQIATSADSASAINQLVSTKAVSNPADLLPISSANDWSNLNPVSSSDLRNINLLTYYFTLLYINGINFIMIILLFIKSLFLNLTNPNVVLGFVRVTTPSVTIVSYCKLGVLFGFVCIKSFLKFTSMTTFSFS